MQQPSANIPTGYIGTPLPSWVALQTQLSTAARLVQNSQIANEDSVLYKAGLQAAAAFKRQAVAPETQSARDKDLQELESWLLRQTAKDLLTFQPVDFEVYLTTTWLKEHGRAGSQPSPSTLNKLVSNLTGELDLLGREGSWQQSTGTTEL